MIRLRELRQARGLTQKQLGEKLCVSYATVSCYEVGRTEPSVSTLIAMADELDCTVDELVGRDNKCLSKS